MLQEKGLWCRTLALFMFVVVVVAAAVLIRYYMYQVQHIVSGVTTLTPTEASNKSVSSDLNTDE